MSMIKHANYMIDEKESERIYEQFKQSLFKPSNEAFNKIFADCLVFPQPKNLLPENEIKFESTFNSPSTLPKPSTSEKKSHGSSKIKSKKLMRLPKKK